MVIRIPAPSQSAEKGGATFFMSMVALSVNGKCAKMLLPMRLATCSRRLLGTVISSFTMSAKEA